MTVQEFIDIVGTQPWWVFIIAFAIPPALTKILGWIHGYDRGKETPWRHIYSILVYLVCLPGMFSAVLTGYTLFIVRENLLDTNLYIYFLPVISMIVALVFISQNTRFKDIPGFDKLSGLMTITAVVFILVLAISKTRIWLLFGGSIFLLGGLIIALLAFLQWGAYTLFRKNKEPQRTRPRFKLK